MGGKGQRRREKNYKSAHGTLHSRLPPPPDPSQLDVLPSKLRKLISLSSSSSLHNDSAKASKPIEPTGMKRDNDKKTPTKDAVESEPTVVVDDEGDEHPTTTLQLENDGEIVSKKKRKRKQVKDLRFETELGNSKTNEKRKERKKKYLEAKKKKHKKQKADENLDFPGHEKIKFGDVVQAPPKLIALPKVQKNFQTASQERVRLQAIENYRNRKGWTSRPGLKLPSTPPL